VGIARRGTRLRFFLSFLVCLFIALVVVRGHRDLFLFVIVAKARAVVIVVFVIAEVVIVICGSCVELDRVVERHFISPGCFFTSCHYIILSLQVRCNTIQLCISARDSSNRMHPVASNGKNSFS
jgi:hypothetical protein